MPKSNSLAAWFILLLCGAGSFAVSDGKAVEEVGEGAGQLLLDARTGKAFPPGMKDPHVFTLPVVTPGDRVKVRYNGSSHVYQSPPLSRPGERLMLVGDYGANRIRAYGLDDVFAVERETTLTLPLLGPGEMRWAPAALVTSQTLYLYSARGRAASSGSAWGSFRIWVAEAELARDIERDAAGILRSIRFSRERPLDLYPEARYGDTDDFDLIDPEVIEADGRFYLYYVVVLAGRPDVRYHEHFIRSRPLRTPRIPEAPETDQLIYSGLHDSRDGSEENVDDGVAEAPTLARIGDVYVMLFSSYPSDHGQRIVALRSRAAHGAPWTDRRVVYASDGAARPWRMAPSAWERRGVGGQALAPSPTGGGGWMLVYQGLGVESDRAAANNSRDRFRFGVMDITPFINAYAGGE